MRIFFRARGLLMAMGLGVLLAPIAGCGNDKTPVQTTAGDIEQYLAEHPDEAYSSDSASADMDAAEANDGSGDSSGAE